jgi:hypothetical protein
MAGGMEFLMNSDGLRYTVGSSSNLNERILNAIV